MAGLTERMRRNASEAEELADVVIIGKRLILKINEMTTVLQDAVKSMETAHRHHGASRPYVVDVALEHSAVNSVLRSAEDQLPMLIALAKSFHTDAVDIPSVGRLQMLQDTFRGNHGTPNRTQLGMTIAEMEAVAKAVDHSVSKLERIRSLRTEAATRARDELVVLLTTSSET